MTLDKLKEEYFRQHMYSNLENDNIIYVELCAKDKELLDNDIAQTSKNYEFYLDESEEKKAMLTGISSYSSVVIPGIGTFIFVIDNSKKFPNFIILNKTI